MEPRLQALKALLDALGVGAEISTVADRKRIQKAVYLGQRAGANLGYRFGWYVRGPYSPPLADAYYALANALAMGDEPPAELRLNPNLATPLKKLLPVLKPPEGITLSQEDWLELLASWDYLLAVSKATPEAAVEKLKREKPLLAPMVENAVDARAQAGLE